MTTGKTIALTRWTFVTKVISQLFTSLWSINKMMYGALITSGLTGGDSPYTLDSFLFSSFLVKNSNLEDPYSSLGFPGSSDGKNSAYNIIKYYIKFNNIYYKMQEILYKLCVIYVYAIYIYMFKKCRRSGFYPWVYQGMAAHSSILAWRILWTEKPVGLQSMRSQRVGHDWVANTLFLLMRSSNYEEPHRAESKKHIMFIKDGLLICWHNSLSNCVALPSLYIKKQ